ncbi:MAG: hypothetical protein ACKVRN_11565 [Pyrinomonadaceae bacterium]
MKKTITTIAMAMVFTFGATFANAGILVGDRGTTQTTCTTSEKDGILVGDRSAIGILVGDIIGFIDGILVGDRTAPAQCSSDRDGILVGD